jgi:hypothetical protein
MKATVRYTGRWNWGSLTLWPFIIDIKRYWVWNRSLDPGLIRSIVKKKKKSRKIKTLIFIEINSTYHGEFIDYFYNRWTLSKPVLVRYFFFLKTTPGLICKLKHGWEIHRRLVIRKTIIIFHISPDFNTTL